MNTTTQNKIVAVVPPRKIEIRLARVVEHTPGAKRLHDPDMANEVRKAINRWLYEG